MLTIDEAREFLRIDGTDNDAIITALLEALPPYLEATTGYSEDTHGDLAIARTAGQFLLQQWYYGENADTDKLQRVIDSLLKALSSEIGQLE